MKRYAKEFEWADMEESDAGEWVRYEDVRAALAQAVERNDEDVKCLLEAREAIAQRDAALARAEAAERALVYQQAMVEHEEHLTRQLCVVQSELRQEKERFAEMVLEFGGAKDRAEAEAAALRAEVERRNSKTKENH